MSLNGYQWIDIHGHPWISMVVYSYLRISMDIDGYPPRRQRQGQSEIKAPPVFNPRGSAFQRATFSKDCCNVRVGTRNGPATDFGFVGVGCFY